MSSSTDTPGPIIESFPRGVDPTVEHSHREISPGYGGDDFISPRKATPDAGDATPVVASSDPSARDTSYRATDIGAMWAPGGGNDSSRDSSYDAEPVTFRAESQGEAARGEAAAKYDRAESDLAGFVDPAPFVGTRDVGDAVPSTDTQPGVVDIVPPQLPATSHPFAEALREIAARIDHGELSFAEAERMPPEASLAAVLAELLKRPR